MFCRDCCCCCCQSTDLEHQRRATSVQHTGCHFGTGLWKTLQTSEQTPDFDIILLLAKSLPC
jgi:hypothetical protein